MILSQTNPVLRYVAGDPEPPSELYANRPPSYTTTVQDYAFNSATYPTSNDAPVGDSSGWNVSFNSPNYMTRQEDATAPVSPSNVMQNEYPDGMNAGDGCGNLYYNLNTSWNALYIAFSVWHDSNFEWNEVSNKMLYWESGNLILQSRHFDEYLSFYVGATDTVIDPNEYVPDIDDFNGRWANVEMLVVRGGSPVLQIWLDGVLVTDATPTMPNTSGESVIRWDSTWGGVTGPKTRASYRRIDNILIARP